VLASDIFKGLADSNTDCYRMRVEDDYKFAGEARGLYNDENPLPDFQQFFGLPCTRRQAMQNKGSIHARSTLPPSSSLL
jgi:hypothetical protein